MNQILRQQKKYYKNLQITLETAHQVKYFFSFHVQWLWLECCLLMLLSHITKVGVKLTKFCSIIKPAWNNKLFANILWFRTIVTNVSIASIFFVKVAITLHIKLMHINHLHLRHYSVELVKPGLNEIGVVGVISINWDFQQHSQVGVYFIPEQGNLS